jgi:hypothetical protein
LIKTEKKADVEGDERVTGKDWEDQRFDRPGFHPKDPLPCPSLGEIGRFWGDLEAPGEVVTMQSRPDKDVKAHFFGRYNLWLLWVLSTVFPLGVSLIVTPAARGDHLCRRARESRHPRVGEEQSEPGLGCSCGLPGAGGGGKPAVRGHAPPGQLGAGG